jgi:hypothetical protein
MEIVLVRSWVASFGAFALVWQLALELVVESSELSLVVESSELSLDVCFHRLRPLAALEVEKVPEFR